MESKGNPFALNECTVLVTGASSGIGRAVAVLVSRMGGRVLALGRDADKLEETLGLLSGTGHSCHSLDLTDLAAIEERVPLIVKESGPVGGFVHSAGVTDTVLLRDADFGKLQDMMTLNYFSFMALSKQLCRRGRHTEGFSVVALSSTAALRGQSGMSFYSATKGALISAVTALAAEYAGRRIRFNCVCPCHVETPMHETVRRQLGEEWYAAEVESRLKLGLLDPEDAADAVVFLLSQASRKVTGTNFVIDGGALLG